MSEKCPICKSSNIGTVDNRLKHCAGCDTTENDWIIADLHKKNDALKAKLERAEGALRDINNIRLGRESTWDSEYKDGFNIAIEAVSHIVASYFSTAPKSQWKTGEPPKHGKYWVIQKEDWEPVLAIWDDHYKKFFLGGYSGPYIKWSGPLEPPESPKKE